jgi:hypothetical protein
MINTGQIMPFLMTLVIQGIFLNFVLKLERKQCECSRDIRRDIIKHYSVVLIALSLLMIVVPKKSPLLVNYVLPLTGLLNLVYIGVVVSYVHNLVNKKCECSGTWGRDIMYYYSLLILAVILLSLVTMVGSLIIIKV